MKKILYVLLYSPFLNWETLIKWFKEILSYYLDAHQFLLYFKKELINNRYIWHVGEHPQEAVLTYCAFCGCLLNSELEGFSHDMFMLI